MNAPRVHAARPVNLAHLNAMGLVTNAPVGERPKYKVLGVDKDRVNRTVDMASLAVTTEGVFENVIGAAQTLDKASNPASSIFKGRVFSKIFNIVSSAFSLLAGVLSLYSVADDARALKGAYKKKDYESMKDRSLSLLANSSNASASGVSASVSIYKLKGMSAMAKGLSPVAAWLAVGVFAVYSVIQAVMVKRIRKAVGIMKGILQPDSEGAKEARLIEKYKDAMTDLYDRIGITRNEMEKIYKKLDSRKHDEAFIKEANRLIAYKQKKLERRAGAEITVLVKESAHEILIGLESSDVQTRARAIKRAEALLTKYKCALYKTVKARIVGVAAGVIGAIGAGLALANPVGAAIASGVLLAAASALIVYAWYGETRWSDSEFVNGLKIMGKKVSNFVIPNADQVIQQERKIEWIDQEDPRRSYYERKRWRDQGQKIFGVDPVVLPVYASKKLGHMPIRCLVHSAA